MISVLKFGGSSLTVDGIHNIKNIVTKKIMNGYKVIIVLSAIQKTTNLLLKTAIDGDDQLDSIKELHTNLLAQLELDKHLLNEDFDQIYELTRQLNSNPLDPEHWSKKIQIIGSGECLSSKLMHAFLNKHLGKTILLNALRFVSNENNSSKIDRHTLMIPGRFDSDGVIIKNLIKDYSIAVTQGFIGKTQDDRMCIMGRSGSDATASLIGSSIGAPVEIWTDVAGIYTGDPRIIHTAKVIKQVSYEICQEISTMGSHVIHPLAIEPCREKGIPIMIKNTKEPDLHGTIITSHISPTSHSAFAVSVQRKITIFEVRTIDMWNQFGFAAKLFGYFGKYEIDVNIITTSNDSISVTTEEKNIKKMLKLENNLKKEFSSVKRYSNYDLVTVISKNIFVSDEALNKN